MTLLPLLLASGFALGLLVLILGDALGRLAWGWMQ